ncbi:hypothetical protein LCGC14_1675610, partial [marine sediment metagenome]
TSVWSYGRMSRGSHLAFAAAGDTVECAKMASAIQGAVARPTVAAEHERLAAETTRLIEQAARAAKISPDRLVRISPEPPQRLGDTVYKEKPTQVLLKNITLKQLVVLAHTLMGASEGLSIKSIRVTAPRSDSADDRWTAEIVVTYLIYAPPLEK